MSSSVMFCFQRMNTNITHKHDVSPESETKPSLHGSQCNMEPNWDQKDCSNDKNKFKNYNVKLGLLMLHVYISNNVLQL